MKEITVILKREQHRNTDVLSVYMPHNAALNAIAKRIGAHYSSTKRGWWLPWSKEVANSTYLAYKDIAPVDYSALKEGNEKREQPTDAVLASEPSPVRERNTEPRKRGRKNPLKDFAWTEEQKQAMWAMADYMKLRRYAPSSYRHYGHWFKKLLAAHPAIHPNDITKEQMHSHLLKLVKEKNYAARTQIQIAAGMQFYYVKVLGRPIAQYYIPTPKKGFKLPVVASEEEIVRMLVASGNLKHQCIISMLYSTGARRDELVNMRLIDVDIDRNQVIIRQGKGKKDRVTLLSQRMVVALQKYLAVYKPHYWLFEGSERKKYTGTSIGKVVRDARITAGIEKKITAHVLRHSFATHLMDNGTDTRIIQTLLGHASLKTTAIYTYVSTKDFQKIISPLDRIFDDRELINNKLAAPSTKSNTKNGFGI